MRFHALTATNGWDTFPADLIPDRHRLSPPSYGELKTMAKTLENKIIDIRTVDRYIERNFLSRDDYAGHLEKLPDVASQATAIEVEIGEAEDDDKAQQAKASES